MNENVELLNYIHEDSLMGISSLTTMIRKLNDKDNKIKKLIESELKDYEHYKKESEKMLKKYKGEVLEASIMAKTMAKMKLNFDIMKDNSDSKIADILTRGFTMGTIDMNKKIDEYKKSSDKNVLKLGSSLSIEQTKEGTLVIGGTREFSGFDKENTLEGIEVMLKRAVEFFPAIKDLNFIRAFAGLRPFTPDGLPLIGEVDKIKGFYIAAGHEGDGIALAPISGKLLAELITDGKPSYNIDHFTPNRFEL